MYFGTKPGKDTDLTGYLRIGRGNPWIKSAWDPPFNEDSFALITSPDEMRKAFEFGNWCNGTAFIYRDPATGAEACFIEQGEANNEWLTIRRLSDGTAVAFESISWLNIIRRPKIPQAFELELETIIGAADDEITGWLDGEPWGAYRAQDRARAKLGLPARNEDDI
jgi:hypothetical protein